MTEAPAPRILPPTVLEGVAELDGAVDALRALVDDALPPGDVRDALQGEWLGHPVHPMLTDLAIGFWTSAFVLDLVPVKRLRAAADVFVALGLAAAGPTVATGLADWSRLPRERQRVGVVHAAEQRGCVRLLRVVAGGPGPGPAGPRHHPRDAGRRGRHRRWLPRWPSGLPAV